MYSGADQGTWRSFGAYSNCHHHGAGRPYVFRRARRLAVAEHIVILAPRGSAIGSSNWDVSEHKSESNQLRTQEEPLNAYVPSNASLLRRLRNCRQHGCVIAASMSVLTPSALAATDPVSVTTVPAVVPTPAPVIGSPLVIAPAVTAAQSALLPNVATLKADGIDVTMFGPNLAGTEFQVGLSSPITASVESRLEQLSGTSTISFVSMPGLLL